jgi:hypothetical protein
MEAFDELRQFIADNNITFEQAETVNHPPHYQSVSPIGLPILQAMGIGPETLELECIVAIEIIEAIKVSSFSYLNAIKYLWRCGMKGHPEEDLKKAQWYLTRWLSKNGPENPRVKRRAMEALSLIESTIDELEGE